MGEIRIKLETYIFAIALVFAKPSKYFSWMMNICFALYSNGNEPLNRMIIRKWLNFGRTSRNRWEFEAREQFPPKPIPHPIYVVSIGSFILSSIIRVHAQRTRDSYSKADMCHHFSVSVNSKVCGEKSICWQFVGCRTWLMGILNDISQ